jgi:hypothetical protein
MRVLGLCSNGAGAGKDEVANALVKGPNVHRVSIADPLKRFCASVFHGVTERHLWGPSEARNQELPNFTWRTRLVGQINWVLSWNHFEAAAPAWLEEMALPKTALGPLRLWMLGLELSARGIDRATGHSMEAVPFTMRRALQQLGTEMMRTQRQDVLISCLFRQGEKLNEAGMVYDRTVGVRLAKDSEANVASTGTEPGIVIPDCRYDDEAEAILARDGKVIRVDRPGVREMPVGATGHATERGISAKYVSAAIPNTGTIEQLHWLAKTVCGYVLYGTLGEDAGSPPDGRKPEAAAPAATP